MWKHRLFPQATQGGTWQPPTPPPTATPATGFTTLGLLLQLSPAQPRLLTGYITLPQNPEPILPRPQQPSMVLILQLQTLTLTLPEPKTPSVAISLVQATLLEVLPPPTVSMPRLRAEITITDSIQSPTEQTTAQSTETVPGQVVW